MTPAPYDIGIMDKLMGQVSLALPSNLCAVHECTGIPRSRNCSRDGATPETASSALATVRKPQDEPPR